ncbi:MAG: hypothetical protein HY866_11835 [Chloroflexi bacterium]|nr:hypothetical protein [Chloroflexota bacterium]
MARKKDKEAQEQPVALRHPLLLYYNLGRRYHPPGLFLFLMGLFLLLPAFIRELENDDVDPEALAGVGSVLILVGIAFLLFSRLAKRRAYVYCRPDLLEIKLPFYRVLVSYRRINMVQSVQALQLFSRESLKGMSKPLMSPLMAMTAVEVQVKSWPVSKKRLRRMISRYMFSPRVEGWVFIVPNYSILMRQIEEQRQKHEDDLQGKTSGSYKDPFERYQEQLSRERR